MPETKISDALENLLKPIREKPVSSLIFFSALFAIGLYVRQWIPEKPEALGLALA